MEKGKTQTIYRCLEPEQSEDDLVLENPTVTKRKKNNENEEKSSDQDSSDNCGTSNSSFVITWYDSLLEVCSKHKECINEYSAIKELVTPIYKIIFLSFSGSSMCFISLFTLFTSYGHGYDMDGQLMLTLLQFWSRKSCD